MHPPVRTAVVDAYEIDVAGVTALLARYDQRVEMVDLGSGSEVDVILYGVRERGQGHDAGLHTLLRGNGATVIALGWQPDDVQVEWALACGADGQLSKTMSAEQLVSGLERIHRGRREGRVLPADGHCHPAVRVAGLTARELEVLSLITLGLTNQEIADLVFISINSVKTYVRTAYRKIGVTRRSQAVSWGIQHGLDVAEDTAPVAAPVP
ncbi:response regulator transcription factor [Nocardioides coralli]|uniref:response regulator transcription factor n=1 Tax=Nocardioides coralli TaxID=2872154 RepID=UPI001CA41FBF|nr:response regulator transcription factor [Nocardioides coralli]QZY28324.1 response regulator transcription factor [Nocardioides coralli]